MPGPAGSARPTAVRLAVWVGVGVLLLWPGLAVARSGDVTGATAPAQSSAGPASAASACLPASAALVDAVERGLVADAAALGRAHVVPASGVEATYVAAEVMRRDLPGEAGIAVWVTNDAEGRGSVFAVDGLAAASSIWTSAGETGVGFSLQDPAARQAVACAAAG